MENFESTATVQNVPMPVRQRIARSVEAPDVSVVESPNVSLTRSSQALGISVSSLCEMI